MRLSNNPIVVRPTLIVGLGGTGVLVCQWAEHYVRRLLGYVPPFIRFLKLDTDASDEGGPPEGLRSDFINLFHYVDVGEVVRDNATYPEFHPHLDWMRGFREDATFADYGCQGIPRLGRLVFFELRETVIHEAVAARFSSLRTSTQQALDDEPDQFVLATDGAPAVHIASSVCGGTGAGMLIDMAYNLRWWSRESFPKPAEVIGHLLLPDAFRVDPMLRPKLEATACATLDQIGFLSDERRPDIRVTYRSSRSGEQCFRKDTSPFNFLYLLNGEMDMGSGDRRHLVRLIARVIRAMTVEPLSQQVRSDANNKLAEILPQRDPVSNHRQCFSSYGFWCGTPGHRRADLESRILADIEELTSTQDGVLATYRQEVQKEITARVANAPQVADLIQPALTFTWDPPGRGSSAEVVSHVLRSLRHYLETSFIPVARKDSEKVLSPGEPISAFLEAAEQMIDRDFFNGAHLKPVNQVGVCLDAWVQGLDELLTRTQGSSAPKISAAMASILKNVKVSLESLQSRVSPLSWTTSDVMPLLDEAVDSHWPMLAEALLHEDRLGSLKATLRVFSIRKQALEALVALAWQRRSAGERVHRLDAEDSLAGQTRLPDFFSTPLCTSLESADALDPVAARDFRQRLIKPVLFETALSIKGVASDLAEVKSVEDRMLQSLTGLSGDMRRFVHEFESRGWDVFKNAAVAQHVVNDHPYYRTVCETWRLAEPKIDLSKTGKYAMPLEVTVTQQVPDSCVPQLLIQSCEVSLREASVSDGYRRMAGEWLQVLRLCYGFCLEAISRYHQYVVATDEYVKRMGFEYSDLWLDKSWYVSYRSAVAEWRSQIGLQKDRLERQAYEANAAKVGSFSRLVESVGQRLRHSLPLLTEPEVAVRMAEQHGRMDSRIALLLQDLPLGKHEAVQRDLSRGVALVEGLLETIRQCAADLSEAQEQTIHDVIRKCRDELDEFKNEMSGPDRVDG